jgi:hypothetical protein
MSDRRDRRNQSGANVVSPGIGTRCRRALLAAGVSVLVAAAATAPQVATASVAIPPGPFDPVVTPYEGAPAAAGSALRSPRVPVNPFMSANGTSSMHDDAYATDAYRHGGPRGVAPTVTSAFYGVSECATMAFDRSGRIVALCGDLEGPKLELIDPTTLDVLTSYALPGRKVSGTSPLEDLCGGAYFYLDQHGRAVVETTDAHIQVLKHSAAAFTLLHDYDLSSAVPSGDCLIALMPDWSGHVWFVTQGGTVGTYSPASHALRTMRLRGEKIVNSLATDETGGVYVVSDHALYRFDAERRGRPVVSWRQAYDRGSVRKPGQLSQGSGTTPTLVGRRLVTITDNAEPRMHVLSFLRTKRHVAHRQQCKVSVFKKGESDTENSIVAVGHSVVAENNYGYTGPTYSVGGRSTTPGLSRVDVRRGHCRVMWTAPESAPTSVAKASLSTGLLYAYTKPAGDVRDPWYLSAINLRTGKLQWRRLTGTGPAWNNHYAAIYLRGRSAYIATMTGLVRVTDS